MWWSALSLAYLLAGPSRYDALSRHAPLRCTAVSPLTISTANFCDFSTECRVGLPTTTHVCEVATLLVECFYTGGGGEELPRAADGLTSTEPREVSDALPAHLDEAPGPVKERWRLAAKGLQWRLGGRLEEPVLDVSMETSLMLVLQDRATQRMVACAELSLRPVDGKLPSEFACPPLFMLHSEAKLGAYLSNLCVAATHRRRGLARQLLATCEDVVRDNWSLPVLYLHVDLQNTAAAEMYRACGYEQLPDYDQYCRPPAPEQAERVLNRYHQKVLV